MRYQNTDSIGIGFVDRVLHTGFCVILGVTQPDNTINKETAITETRLPLTLSIDCVNLHMNLSSYYGAVILLTDPTPAAKDCSKAEIRPLK